MRFACATTVLATGVLLACSARAGSQGEGTHIVDCGPPPTPTEPPHSDIRLGSYVDSTAATRGVAELVFRVRSAGPAFHGTPLQGFSVLLRDTLTLDAPPLHGIGDSSGIAVVRSVPVGYTSAHVQRIGYFSYTVPLAVRPGYTDEISVALAEACVYHSASASVHRLQN